jgi:uncharacterized Zn finger protein
MHIEGDNPNLGNGSHIPGPNDHLKNAEDVKCEKCEGTVFIEAMMMKKVSKFLTGADRDTITPIPVVACAACGHVNEMFIPKF